MKQLQRLAGRHPRGFARLLLPLLVSAGVASAGACGGLRARDDQGISSTYEVSTTAENQARCGRARPLDGSMPAGRRKALKTTVGMGPTTPDIGGELVDAHRIGRPDDDPPGGGRCAPR